MRPRSRSGLGMLLLVMALAGALDACAGDNPPSPVATPAPSTAVTVAPRTFVLHAAQLRQYKHVSDETVSARSLANDEQDPALAVRLQSQGFELGARATFSTPDNQSPPFQLIISEALLFDTTAGATTFFADESKRRDVPPAGGTVAVLPGVSAAGSDQTSAFTSTEPPQGDNIQRTAYLAVIRRGRVVAEILGGGDTGTVTPSLFAELVGLQASQLTSGPTV